MCGAPRLKHRDAGERPSSPNLPTPGSTLNAAAVLLHSNTAGSPHQAEKVDLPRSACMQGEERSRHSGSCRTVGRQVPGSAAPLWQLQAWI